MDDRADQGGRVAIIGVACRFPGAGVRPNFMTSRWPGAGCSGRWLTAGWALQAAAA